MRSLNEILVQRGRLLERVTTQRYFLMAQVQPVRKALDRTDRALAQVQAGVAYIKRYPAVAGVALAVMCAFNVRRVFRLARRGFIVWRTWRMLRERVAAFGWPGFR